MKWNDKSSFPHLYYIIREDKFQTKLSHIFELFIYLCNYFLIKNFLQQNEIFVLEQ